ncbi:MAG: DUF1614 domain-containing protein [Candidatus Bathyarchaeia archaeon]|jgi:uncharacterized membrane protein
MSRKTIYFPHSFLVFAFLLVLLFVVVALIFLGLVSIAFSNVGFTPLTIFLLLIGTLVGSFINIPVLKMRTKVPVMREEQVSWYGVTFKIPQLEYGQAITVIAVNVGGAIVPTAVSIYLLSRSSTSLVILSLIGVLAVAAVTHAVARPIKGVGIATPAFLPPIAAAVVAFILAPGEPRTVAYVAGTLGTLIGADLLNLKKIPKLGTPMASIGGAGTFDGVFLTGIIAVLLTRL